MGDQQTDLDKIITYLSSQTSLSLCCVDDGMPYCCTCFYVLDAQRISFYFSSSLNTYHANIMLKSSRVAGTVADQTQSVMHLQGVQYQGRVKLLMDEEEKRARQLFYASYPIAKLKKAPMWEIMLNSLKMTNNKLGFGKKLLWSRNG